MEWQPLTTRLGYDVPDLVVEAGEAGAFAEAMERSAALSGLVSERFPAHAPYAVALAFRLRYVMQMNAREAMHLIELRSGIQGHPSYRRVAQEMHRLIGEVAGHRAIASAMVHVDPSPAGLGRLEAERRAESRRSGRDARGAADAGGVVGYAGGAVRESVATRPAAATAVASDDR